MWLIHAAAFGKPHYIPSAVNTDLHTKTLELLQISFPNKHQPDYFVVFNKKNQSLLDNWWPQSNRHHRAVKLRWWHDRWNLAKPTLNSWSGGGLRLWGCTIPLIWPIASSHACDLDKEQESMQAHGITLIPCGKNHPRWMVSQEYIELSKEAQIKSRKSPFLCIRRHIINSLAFSPPLIKYASERWNIYAATSPSLRSRCAGGRERLGGELRPTDVCRRVHAVTFSNVQDMCVSRGELPSSAQTSTAGFQPFCLFAGVRSPGSGAAGFSTE